MSRRSSEGAKEDTNNLSASYGETSPPSSFAVPTLSERSESKGAAHHPVVYQYSSVPFSRQKWTPIWPKNSSCISILFEKSSSSSGLTNIATTRHSERRRFKWILTGALWTPTLRGHMQAAGLCLGSLSFVPTAIRRTPCSFE